MTPKKWISILITLLNILGVICLIYYAIPYLSHDVTIPNPDAMLPAQAWDMSGFSLTIGLIPLAIANALAFIFIKVRKVYLRLLFFLPSVICLFIVLSYLFYSL